MTHDPTDPSSDPPTAHKALYYPTLVPDAIAIGSSTGGPQALLTLFRALHGRVPNVPFYISQHMPADFTTTLARQITEASGVPCIEATDNIATQRKHIYLAPGDYHMVIEPQEKMMPILHLNQEEQEHFCRPSVDVMLRSLIPIYQSRLLLIILTGMGQDGCKEAQKLHQCGGTVVIQDQASSAVWGMPGAVHHMQSYNVMLPLSDIAEYIIEACGGDV